jgi:ATP-dependent RNA helicase RhlE
VNFDVPNVPEDYIHRVGRTARAEMTGDAFTFVSPEEEADLRAIERAIGKRLPRVVLPDFNPRAAVPERFEVPLAERIAAIRARKSQERARAREKEDRRRAGGGAPRPAAAGAPHRSGTDHSGGPPSGAAGRPAGRPPRRRR